MFKQFSGLAIVGLVSMSAFAATPNNAYLQSVQPAPSSPHKMGIGVALPAGGGIGGGPTAAISWGLTENTSLRTNFGLQIIKKKDADTQWGFGIDAGYRMYMNDNAVRIFWQPALSFGKKTSASPHSENIYFGVGVGIGGEYFVAQNWSFGAETNFSFLFENSFNDVKISTGTTALTANFYW